MITVRPVFALLALASLLIAGSASAQDAIADAAPGDVVDALLGDFIEVGYVQRGIPRDHAVVELVNETAFELDVTLGQGAATLQPRETMFARILPGAVPILVVARNEGQDRLEGDLQVEQARHYRVSFAWGRVRITDDGVEPMDTPRQVAPGVPSASSPRGSRRGRDGKVEIGRKRR